MSVKESNYLLSCEEDENNLNKFLITMTDFFWQKYDFENLRDPEDLNKVLFRMALKVSHSGDEILWKFTWEKIRLLHLEEYVLTEGNYEVAISTVINCEQNRSFILRTAKQHLDNLDYRRMLTCVAFTAIKAHGKAAFGLVHNNIECLNFLWENSDSKEKWLILINLPFPSVRKLFGILFTKYIVEDDAILRFLKEKTSFQPELQYNLFLSDKMAEAVLSEFLKCSKSLTLESLAKLWGTQIENTTTENKDKASLRLYLKCLANSSDNVTKCYFKASVPVEQRKNLFQGANYYAAKFILETCPQSKLHQFFTEAVNCLNRKEIIEMLTEVVEDTVYWHGRIFDDKVVDNLNRLQVLMAEFRTLKVFDTIEVFRSLKMTTKTKLDLMLQYADSEDIPECLLGSYILTNKTAEKSLVNFIDTINKNELGEKSLSEEWNSRGLNNLNSKNLYSALFRVFIFSIGSGSDVRYQWIWKRIEEATAEIKVLLEQNYFFIKTVMDLSDADLLKRALKTAMVYLDKEQMHHVYKEAYLHAVKWHGAFVNEKIWNATLSLETLKKVSCRHQWDNLFEHLDEYKCVKEPKRSLDLPPENDSNKKIRVADEKS